MLINKKLILSIILTNVIYDKEDRPCTYKRDTEERSLNQSCRGTAICIIYSECVSGALLIQQAERMRHITIWVWFYRIFPNYLKKGKILGKKLLNIICVF
jgi:hypothetical protein